MHKPKILITGGTRGIGKAAVQLLCNQYEIWYTGTQTSSPYSLKHTTYLQLDLASDDSIKKCLTKIPKDLFAVINNAGITVDESVPANLARQLKVNYISQVSLTNKLLEQSDLKKIIFITSMLAFKAKKTMAGYQASKAALTAYAKALSLKLTNANVNCIAPGYTKTDMTKHLSIENLPYNRMARPEEIAYLIEYLLSSKADYINGQTLHVNGGLF